MAPTHFSLHRFAALIVVAVGAVPACRFGYEQPTLSGGGASSQGGLSADAGASSSRAGQSSTHGGSSSGAGATDGGGSASTDGGAGGASTNLGGQTSLAGESSVAGTDGLGMGGAGVAPSCTPTADCACDTFGDHGYWFCTQHLYWTDANAHCQTAGMRLVRVDSQAENDFLVSAGTAHGVFAFNNFAQIGADDQSVAGEWRWQDGTLFWQGGSNGAPVNGAYTNWDNQSPSSGGTQKCSGMLTAGTWQDRTCTGAEPFICESP